MLRMVYVSTSGWDKAEDGDMGRGGKLLCFLSVCFASAVSFRRGHWFSWDGSGCRRRIPDTVDATLVCRLGLPLGLVVCSHRVTLAASAGGGGLPLRSRHPAL